MYVDVLGEEPYKQLIQADTDHPQYNKYQVLKMSALEPAFAEYPQGIQYIAKCSTGDKTYYVWEQVVYAEHFSQQG